MRSLLHVQVGQPALHVMRICLVIPVLCKTLDADSANTAHSMLYVQVGQPALNVMCIHLVFSVLGNTKICMISSEQLSAHSLGHILQNMLSTSMQNDAHTIDKSTSMLQHF